MAGLPGLGSLPQGVPLGTIGSQGSDFGPMMALLEMELRRRQLAQPQLDMRNLLAKQGLRGKIDPATGMPRPDPYGKIGGVLDQDLAAAQEGVGPVPTIRSTGPTLKQRREERKQERTFERSLRRMGVDEREQALTERAQQDFERMQARSLGGMEERRRRTLAEAEAGRGTPEEQDFLDVAAQAREMERTTADVVSDRDRVRQIAANLRTVATALPEGPERERRMRSIERWVREQEDRLEGREERKFQRSRIERAEERQERAEERQERAFARQEAQAERAEMAETRRRNEQRGVDAVSAKVLPVVPFVDAAGAVVPLRDWETSAMEAAQSAIMEATADPAERAAMLEGARARIAQEVAREHQRRTYEFQDQQQADARKRGAVQEEMDFYNFTTASLQRIGQDALETPMFEASRQRILSDSEDLMAQIRNAPASDQPALYRQLGALALEGHMLRLRDTKPELQDADIQDMVGKFSRGESDFDEIAKRLGHGRQGNLRRARFFELVRETQEGMALQVGFEVARGERDPQTMERITPETQAPEGERRIAPGIRGGEVEDDPEPFRPAKPLAAEQREVFREVSQINLPSRFGRNFEKMAGERLQSMFASLERKMDHLEDLGDAANEAEQRAAQAGHEYLRLFGELRANRGTDARSKRIRERIVDDMGRLNREHDLIRVQGSRPEHNLRIFERALGLME